MFFYVYVSSLLGPVNNTGVTRPTLKLSPMLGIITFDERKKR